METICIECGQGSGAANMNEGQGMPRLCCSMTLEEQVHQSLNFGVDNGYDLTERSAQELADDLQDFCQQYEELESEELAPHVQTWLDKKGW